MTEGYFNLLEQWLDGRRDYMIRDGISFSLWEENGVLFQLFTRMEQAG